MARDTATYLVIGGSGFIGSYVVRDLLEEGAKVVVFDLKIDQGIMEKVVSKEKLNDVVLIQGSVTEVLDLFEAIKKHNVDFIIHLAYVLYPASEIPSLSLRVNVVGSNNVFEAARILGLKRVIWMSSMSVFGNLAEFYGDKVVSEKDVVYRPTRLYGATKAFLEFLAKLYNEKYGMDIIGFRPARIYGIGKYSGGGGLEFTGLLENAALDIPTTIKGGHAKWTYGYVEDLSRVIVKACKIPSTKSKMFNVSDGGVYNGWQLAEVIKKVNPTAQIKVEPGSHEAYDFPAQDITALREELGFIPVYPLEKGLREVFNYYRGQKGLPLL